MRVMTIKRIIECIRAFHIKYSAKYFVIVQSSILAVLLLLTVWIWIDAPKNSYFGNVDKEVIWYGNDWSYVNQEGEPVTVYNHYLKLQKNEESVAITKILDDEVLQDKFLCFRVKAEEIRLYVNDSLWQTMKF